MSEKAKISAPLIKGYSITILTPFSMPIVVGQLPNIGDVEKRFIQYYNEASDEKLKSELGYAWSILKYAKDKQATLANMVPNICNKTLTFTFAFSSIKELLDFNKIFPL